MRPRRAVRGRFFVQIYIDDEARWSTFTTVEPTVYRAIVLAEAIRETLWEHPVWGRHELRVVTTSQLYEEGGRRALIDADFSAQVDWLPEQVEVVLSHSIERISGNKASRHIADGSRNAASPVRLAARAIETALAALEDAIRHDRRAMRFVADDGDCTIEVVRRIRAGDTLRAMLVTTGTSFEAPDATRLRARRERDAANETAQGG